MTHAGRDTPGQFLLVEDNPGDVRLIRETLRHGPLRSTLHVAEDGEEALAFLRREGPHAGAPRPDLIVLDLNLPKRDGREVLREVKTAPALCTIPVVVLTTSAADQDVRDAYRLHANGYVTKPVDLERYQAVVRAIETFWLSVAQRAPRTA